MDNKEEIKDIDSSESLKLKDEDIVEMNAKDYKALLNAYLVTMEENKKLQANNAALAEQINQINKEITNLKEIVEEMAMNEQTSI